MLEESGYIVACEDSNNTNIAWVSVERRTACESCAVQKGCGTSVLSKVVGKKIATIKVDNTLHAKVGDQVRIGINDQAMVSGSALMYLLPLLLMFLLAIIVDALFQQEVLTILSSLISLCLSFLLIKSFAKRRSIKQAFQAKMLAIEPHSAVHFSAKLLS